MFRPPILFATQVVPTDPPQADGSRDVYIRASYGLLPLHTSDMLAVRIGQLTAGDFHPFRFAALSAAPPNPRARRRRASPRHVAANSDAACRVSTKLSKLQSLHSGRQNVPI